MGDSQRPAAEAIDLTNDDDSLPPATALAPRPAVDNVIGETMQPPGQPPARRLLPATLSQPALRSTPQLGGAAPQQGAAQHAQPAAAGNPLLSHPYMPGAGGPAVNGATAVQQMMSQAPSTQQQLLHSQQLQQLQRFLAAANMPTVAQLAQAYNTESSQRRLPSTLMPAAPAAGSITAQPTFLPFSKAVALNGVPQPAPRLMQAGDSADSALPAPRRLPPTWMPINGMLLGSRAPTYQAEQPARPIQSPARTWQMLQPQQERDTQQALRSVWQALQGAGDGRQMLPPQGMLLPDLLLHQRMALAWMVGRETGGKPWGGMLCDDQGLGKTVSTIALIITNTREGCRGCLLPQQDGLESGNGAGGQPGSSSADGAAANGSAERGGKASVRLEEEEEEDEEEEEVEEVGAVDAEGLPLGGTLVVTPTSVLSQWESELQGKVAPGAHVTVHKYHGAGRLSNIAALAKYSVVLTTFTTMANEAPTKPDERKGSTSNDPIELDESSSGDEAACVSGAGLPPAKKRRKGSSKGGPLFRISWDRVVLDEAQAIKNPRTLVAHAAWNLHARRRWCLTGTPLQNSVDDLYSYFRFLQYAPWSNSRTFKEQLKEMITSAPATGYRKLQSVLGGILLRRTKQSTINGKPMFSLPPRNERLVKATFGSQERSHYEKIRLQSQKEIKAMNAEGTSAQQRYVNMLLMLLRLRQACNHPWLVAGGNASYASAAAPKPTAAQAAAARKLEAGAREMLLQRLRSPGDACGVCGDISEDPCVSRCGHLFCNTCIHMKVDGSAGSRAEREVNFHCPLCNTALGPDDIFSHRALADARDASASGSGGHTAGGAEHGAGGEGGERYNPGTPSSSGGGGDWQSSAKVDVLMELLEKLRSGGQAADGCPPGSAKPVVKRSKSASRFAAALGAARTQRVRIASDKVIVFSQWTRMLDLLEAPLKKKNFNYRRLDGAMTIAKRDEAIRAFQSDPTITVLIVSLKAASVGLNLTVANHVVLLDLWWNPTVEEQAIDRTHRIGQTKPVHVTRITIEGTVEDNILELQQKKRGVVAATFGAGGDALAAASQRLTLDDLQQLFASQPRTGG